MQIFYAENISKQIFQIEEQEHQHLFKVLRKKVGDEIFVCNGKGLMVKAKITEIDKRKTFLNYLETIKEEKVDRNNLILAVSPTKKREKYEMMIEKCVEIGVSEIVPFYSQNSERRNLNLERLESIVLSAMKQSKSLFLPIINQEISFNELLKYTHINHKYIAYVEEKTLSIKSLKIDCDTKTLFAIGPEGGFTSQEVSLAKENNFIPLSLGEKRLRTETAGIFVATAYQLLK